MAVAIVTGASRGLGFALAAALAARGWDLVVDARDGEALEAAARKLKGAAAGSQVIPVAGDVASAEHRGELVARAEGLGGIDLVVNNASDLGPTPLPPMADYPLGDLEQLYRVNTIAPLGLIQLALPHLPAGGGSIVNVTSDAAVEGYEGWGGYGSSKAALEQMSNVLAAEHPELRIYWVDPGDMRTKMHQDAFPGEDISDRPLPEASVPGLLELVEGDLPSGRYRVQDLEGQKR